jgi:hypothetical protein
MSESNKVPSAESVIYNLVAGASASDVWQIACNAMADKQRLFKEYGWDVNHKINEGDVRCVLRAILATAIDRMETARANSSTKP